MSNSFLSFLESLENVTLENSPETAINMIRELSSDRLPAMLLETYAVSAPAEEAEFGDYVFYGIDRMIEENTDYVPGANLLPLGLFTFASTVDGDCICLDMKDPKFPVYQCSHSMHSGEDDISYSKNSKIYEMPFNYENVMKTAPRLADSFEEFVALLLDGNDEAYSVRDLIDRL